MVGVLGLLVGVLGDLIGIPNSERKWGGGGTPVKKDRTWREGGQGRAYFSTFFASTTLPHDFDVNFP